MFVPDLVTVTVGVGVLVGDCVNVNTVDLVGVGVTLIVTDGDLVGDLVGDGVLVLVRLAVLVGVLVSVTDGVAVAVGAASSVR